MFKFWIRRYDEDPTTSLTVISRTPRKLIAVTGGDGQVFLKEDIQQTAIDDHHHRQAEQITGATPFHLQKLADGHTIQIAPRQMIRTIPHNLIQGEYIDSEV